MAAATDPVIAGVGIVTAVGLTAPETDAAVRAGMMMFAESSIMDRQFQPIVLAEVPEDGLSELAESLRGTGLTAREARLLRLAELPLRECLNGLSASTLPVPLAIALPEQETTRPLDPGAMLQSLSIQVPDILDVKRSAPPLRGRAGGVIAIGRAADIVRSGKAEFVVAGGVDTYRDLYVLGTLDLEARLKTPRQTDGFIPGEGAAFVLLGRRSAVEAAGLAALAAVSAWGQAVEPGHMYSDQPYRGEGLANAIAQAIGRASGGLPIQDVSSSMNGESHWAKEWGIGLLRNRGSFSEDHGMHHPADCYGDIGAAAGPAMVGLAALGLAAGRRRPGALVYGSSDRGDRAAALLAA